jgi:hypothetical protein
MSSGRRWNETALAFLKKSCDQAAWNWYRKEGGELTRYFGQMKNPSATNCPAQMQRLRREARPPCGLLHSSADRISDA